MKVILLSYEDGQGGAGRSAFKLHRAFLANGIDSSLRVCAKTSDLGTVSSHQRLLQKVVSKASSRFTPWFMRLQRTSNDGLHSPALLPAGIVDELNESNADVLQLNWICGLLSVEDIGKLTKPVVWRFSDMWPFSGAEHYGDDGANARWRTGYRSDNRPTAHGGIDIDRWVWNRKRRAWNKPIHIVAPSQWIADCARQSALTRDWPISVIPTTLDVNQFQPWAKAFARQVLGLPKDPRLILFGALSGGTDPRKGRAYLISALSKVAGRLPNVAGVIFGQSEPADPPRLGLPLHWMGHLNDEVTMSLVYSAADVMVIPSRQDNLPQTGVEAQSCGCPLVTFDCSGLPDLLEHKRTGYIAKAFDVDELAYGVEWVLADPNRHRELSRQSRDRSLRLWAPGVVVPQYLEVYERAISEHGTGI